MPRKLRSGRKIGYEGRTGIARPLLPALQGVSDPLRPLVGQAPRDDEQAGVRLAGLEENEIDVEKVVPVAGDEDPALGGREAKLLLVPDLVSIHFMDGEDVEPKPTGNLALTEV